MAINIEDLIDNELLLPIDFLNRYDYRSYIIFEPLDGDELERIAEQAGYSKGGTILFSLQEGPKPTETVVATSLDEARNIVFEDSHKFYVIELIPDTLYVWHEQGNDFFIVFGKEEILKKCVDLDEVKKSYAIELKIVSGSETATKFVKRAAATYNRLAGTQV